MKLVSEKTAVAMAENGLAKVRKIESALADIKRGHQQLTVQIQKIKETEAAHLRATAVRH